MSADECWIIEVKMGRRHTILKRPNGEPHGWTSKTSAEENLREVRLANPEAIYRMRKVFTVSTGIRRYGDGGEA